MSPTNEMRLELLQSVPPNMWVALSPDESNIVAIGESFAEVAILSELAGFFDPVILKTQAECASMTVQSARAPVSSRPERWMAAS